MMKRIFKKILQIPDYIDRKKQLKCQQQVIKEKSAFIGTVKWSDEQQKEYNDFWKQFYGFVPAEEHNKYFESINGIYNPKYIPRALYDYVIEPRFNPPALCRLYENKNLQETLFSNVAGVRLPKTYAACFDGHYRSNDRIVSLDELIKQCSDLGRVLIKPTYWTSSGRNVRILDIHNGIDKKTNESLKKIVSSYGRHFIIQEIITTSKELREISPVSVNTFRVTTFIFENAVHCSPIVMRIGVGNSITDNESNGGYAIGVNDNGTLKKTAYNYESENETRYLSIDIHPDSKTVFEGYHVADVNAIKEAACKLHSRVPDLGICSWDLTVDENNNITFIELNAQYQGTDMAQVTHGEPLFGEYTERILKSIYKAKKIGV